MNQKEGTGARKQHPAGKLPSQIQPALIKVKTGKHVAVATTEGNLKRSLRKMSKLHIKFYKPAFTKKSKCQLSSAHEL